MLHDMLWRANLELVQSCLAHPFVQALGDGTLKTDLFRAFIAQDAFFLRAFLKAYALALARSDDTETIAAFYELIGGVLEEIKLHSAYAAELGIDLQRVVPNPACRAYTDFLLRIAWHTSLGETVAAMTPCMRLYAYIGRELILSAANSTRIDGGSRPTAAKRSGGWRNRWKHCSIGLAPTPGKCATVTAMLCSANWISFRMQSVSDVPIIDHPKT